MKSDPQRENGLFGSARFSYEAELEADGWFEFSDDAIYCGKAFGRRLWYKGPGGVVIVAGARSGKLAGLLGYNICQRILSAETIVAVDIKCELAAISQDQTPDDKYCIYWNPQARFGLPQHRINPVGNLRWSSPSLVSDLKQYLAGMLPESGAGNAKYFEMTARRLGEGLALSLIEAIGVLTLPDLYFCILALQAGGKPWAPYGAEMTSSSFAEVRTLAAEIEAAQTDTSGGWRGVLGELAAAFSCLSDRQLLRSVSAPFDFRLEDMSASERKHQLFLMCQEDMVDLWAPVMKSFLTTMRTLKAKAPDAPRQTWIIDEAARFKNYPEIADLFTIGAGIGVRPIAVFQDVSQMNDLAKNAQRKILSSAQVQLYFGIRDLESAEHVSKLLGEATFEHNDPQDQGRALVDLVRLIGSFLGGRSLNSLFLELQQKRRETAFVTLNKRMLWTTDEVLRMPAKSMFMLTDGQHPTWGALPFYFHEIWMDGRYLPNPYHPPMDKVQVMTRRGRRYRPVVARKVPAAFADFPQYTSGTGLFVEKGVTKWSGYLWRIFPCISASISRSGKR
ncbi:type IV secretory system conjugative DNA transfer family protein [Roseobacter sp. S98]|uniref:type IV secretory system conjugative DNA transfer family protein n=1 Tax=Roseobacter algicola (ex Choi et al. 2025) (nom. illeg.) TaxID=3092138 RepID=UPI0035C762AA